MAESTATRERRRHRISPQHTIPGTTRGRSKWPGWRAASREIRKAAGKEQATDRERLTRVRGLFNHEPDVAFAPTAPRASCMPLRRRNRLQDGVLRRVRAEAQLFQALASSEGGCTRLEND